MKVSDIVATLSEEEKLRFKDLIEESLKREEELLKIRESTDKLLNEVERSWESQMVALESMLKEAKRISKKMLADSVDLYLRTVKTSGKC